MREMRNMYKILDGKSEGKRPIGRHRHGYRFGECGLDSSVSGWGLVTDSCEHGNETLGSIKGRAFLD
jgi:hypothetical protein